MSVAIVGTGMGSSGTLTADAKMALAEAEVLIGAARLLNALPESRCSSRHTAVLAEDILAIISRNRDKRICVLMSGDVGFYSGAKKLVGALPEAELIPGVSCVQYFAALLKRPWEDWKLVSAHGKACDAVAPVRDHAETFFLTGGEWTVRTICLALSAAGLGHCPVTVGENLGGDSQRIRTDTAEMFSQADHAPLSVMLAENPAPRRLVSCGFPDEMFIRGDIPMTKSEVRSVVLSKLRLRENDIVYDIGAGTGSVSVEAALTARCGHVYAFEREKEGCGLIRDNASKFGASNITVTEGSVPETLGGLPVPDAAFIGGSGGRLAEIAEVLLRLNPGIRLVVSAVALETITQTAALFERLPLRDTEAVQIAVTRARHLGEHHLMLAQNPVFIFSGKGRHDQVQDTMLGGLKL
jgi:precorrin-6Y C5,15-methyltransferase (decarboxylating)